MLLFLSSMQKFIGITDLIVILIFLLAIFIGALVGFFRIAIKIANAICGFLFSLVFASKFSRLLGLFIRKPIFKHFYKKVASSSAMTNVDDSASAKSQFSSVLQNYGIPKFIAKYISSHYSVDEAADIKDEICKSMASGITKVILVIISFFILWIGLSIIFFVMRKTLDSCRENTGFRVFDGVLGACLMLLITFVLCEITFYFFTLSKGSTYEFFCKDLRLLSHKGFPLGRWFYNKNLVKAFMDMFF